ncbi:MULTISPECIES: MerC domain-containing protein [Asticcacaulis]|uniref:MerC domain-containing protein n=1 Tax=Asticcacaulis TaxID=76890 RepID=UPI001AE13DA4|nr:MULTISPECIES: MerC domain-containing protein [Asticcacaulis]MBP2160307.1 hypothetical protein [Asticcacaulis solisilvae]MDR6801390.1 hypothetical protein [Asticcacaulis sp. BE141]
MRPVSASSRSSRFFDVLAIGLSGLCVAHCLLLPAFIVALPMLGAFSDEHWVHQVLISAAAPVSLWAVGRSGLWRRPDIGVPMVLGLALLAAAAFYPPLEAHEVPVSVAGALLLAFTHFRNARLAHNSRRAKT